MPWESVDFDELPAQHFVVEPFQIGNGFIRVLSLAIVDFPVGFKRAIKQLSGLVDVHHQRLGGIPGINEDGVERQAFVGDGGVEHVPHMVELGLAVALGVVDPPVDDPILAGVQVDIQAINHADALDKAVFVAAILVSDEFHLGGMALIQHGIVEYQSGICAVLDKMAHGLPNGIRRDIVAHEIPVN